MEELAGEASEITLGVASRVLCPAAWGLLIGDGVACPVPLGDPAGYVDGLVPVASKGPRGLTAALP